MTENPATTGKYENLTISRDKFQLKNKIYVRSGNYDSDLYENIIEADGVQTTFSLAYKPNSPVNIFVDTGGGYVEKTLGIDNADTSGFDFVLNYNLRLIKNLDLATLNAGDLVKVTYRHDVDISIVKTNNDSISNAISEEGGSSDGIYEYLIPDNVSYKTLEAAYDNIVSLLELYATKTTVGFFTTSQYGYKVGQLLNVNMPNWGFDNQNFIINKVTTRSLTINTFEFIVEFSSNVYDIQDFLSELYDKKRNIEVSDFTPTALFDTWIQKKDLPNPLPRSASAVADNRNGIIYAVTSVSFGAGGGNISQYVTNLNKWSDIKTLLDYDTSTHGAQVSITVGDNALYLCYFAASTAYRIYKYDIDTDTLTTLGDDKAGTNTRQMVYAQNFLYIFRTGFLDFYKYDLSGAFTPISLTAPGINGNSMCYDNNDSIYLHLNTISTNQFRRYSILNDSWTVLTPAPTTGRNSANGIWYNQKHNKIYMLSYDYEFWEYDIVTDTWTQKTTMKSGDTFNGTSVVSPGVNQIYGIDGIDEMYEYFI